MGQSSSRLSRGDIKKLRTSTHYSEKQIKQLHKIFTNLYPNGLNEEEFCSLSHLVRGGLSNIIFLAADNNHDGRISFEEYITIKSIEDKGSVHERIRWHFRIFDVDNDGYINRKDMHLAMSGVYESNGPILEYLPGSVDKIVDNLFTIMDTDKDGLISLREFQVQFQNPSAVNALFPNGQLSQLVSVENPHHSFVNEEQYSLVVQP